MSLFKSKISSNEGYFPITIGNLIDLKKNQFIHNGKLIKEVEIVGKLASVNNSTYYMELVLQDSTNKITAEVFYMKDSEKYYGCPKNFKFLENFYYNVFGAIKLKNDYVCLVVCHIESVSQRTIINEFLSRTILAKIHKENVEEMVLNTIDQNGMTDGLTLEEIMEKIEGKANITDVDNKIIDLLMSGVLKNGITWDHYMLNTN